MYGVPKSRRPGWSPEALPDTSASTKNLSLVPMGYGGVHPTLWYVAFSTSGSREARHDNTEN